MLTREGATEIKDIKMFRPLHQDEASTSNSHKCVQSCPVLVCSKCKYKFCWDCFVTRVKTLPVEVLQIVLQKWFDSEDCMLAYNSEFPYRNRPWRVFYAFSREPVPTYFGFVQNTDSTWQDYFTIHQRARIHGYVRVIAYATQLDSAINWWSPWFKLFVFKYMPRSSWMINSDFLDTISSLIWEIHFAAQYDYTVEF